MGTREIAEDYAAMVAAGKMDEAAMKYWSDDIATYEAMSGDMPGEMAETHGKDEAIAKATWWMENNEVHSLTSEGPFVHADHFFLIMAIDVTPKGGERMQMREIVDYHVVDDRIISERYCY